MLDMECVIAAFLTEKAVFATVVRPHADEVPSGGINHVCWFDSKLRTALSRRFATNSDTVINASYSLRSSSLRRPSFARSASTATLYWIGAATRNSARRRADSASKHRLSESI